MDPNTQAYRITMIAALAHNRAIGDAGSMPWHLPDDLKQFRRTTLNRPIIMGRKTYASIGQPLKRRTNIVLTRDKGFHVEGVFTAHGVEEALLTAESHLGEEQEVIIGGGAEIYRLFLPYASTLRLTYVDAVVPGDTFFPEISHYHWQEFSRTVHPADDKHRFAFDVVTYQRIERN